ncbi:IclR family transcriptional regulator [Microbacterium sp. QXD-8]|uniref:IclR family transcriptional regulator n=1 Tax=Microbacterium psychrotolerans TaxID=3068321 RepID=A0ABU0YW13_9MICO|nr:IclR family transcriptional regulator [Microbacterium sp. QXD-8]MDQ7876523.1 IclR family transcriptional regulator [Microbacterium sp. QXD-8]
MTPPAPDGGARVVGSDRVLAVLIQLAEHPEGATLDQLAAAVASPKPTVHRALTSLRKVGLAAQLARGVYILGDEFIRLALRNVADRPEAALVTPALERLSARFGETAHYAVLDGADVVYRAKTDPPAGAVRLTSVVGGRNPAYRTAVGKLLLSWSVTSLDELIALLGPGPLERKTPNTLSDPQAIWEECQAIRTQGYAVDDQENELGINCVAVPVRIDPQLPVTGAISVSALAFRLPLDVLVRSVPEILSIVSAT